MKAARRGPVNTGAFKPAFPDVDPARENRFIPPLSLPGMGPVR